MTISTRPLSYVEKALFCLGFLLIWAALVGNEWVLVKLFSPDGVVESYNRVAIRFFEFLLLALGVFCVLMGKLLPSQGRSASSQPILSHNIACSPLALC